MPGPPPVARAAAPPVAVRRPRVGCVRLTYTIEESLKFLQIMEEVLPLGPDEWEHVASLLSTTYPDRSVASLRRKYHDLHRVRVPTGGPHCPGDVNKMKRIK